jgi:hypothetical protein
LTIRINDNIIRLDTDFDIIVKEVYRDENDISAKKETEI